jgi:Uma2 family endonuclease
MMAIATTESEIPTIADLLAELGDIPPHRVLLRPYPGTATEQDIIDIHARHHKRLCELVDGVLVEKAMGFEESMLALLLGSFLINFVRQHDLGIVAGADGTLRLRPGLVRIPDVSFVSWARLPERRSPGKPIPDLAPDLAVEVLSKSNTLQEMERKLREYFQAGVRLVWYIDPEARTVEVFTAVDWSTMLDESQTLDGGDVLPGFALPLCELFPRRN